MRKKILAIIPARGGSKRLPWKNIKKIGGNPMITYAIKAALNSRFVDRVIVTTDDKKIATIARQYGAEVPFMRPKKYAGDKATVVSALQHAINWLEKNENYKIDIMVLIQPTAPLVLPKDVDKLLKKMVSSRVNTCLSVCEINDRPEWMYKIKNNKFKPYLKLETREIRGQDLETLYRINGAVYAVKKDYLMNKNSIIDDSNMDAIIMPKERSVDIDDIADFEVAETLMKQLQYDKKNNKRNKN